MTRTPVVGIVGAGQLARMMYQAAIPLGIDIRLLAGRPDDSAALIAHNVTLGSPDSLDALRAFAATCGVVTFDHELVEPDHLRELEQAGHVLRPGAETAAIVVDKRQQRAAMRRIGVPTPDHAVVASIADIDALAARAGWPVVLKTARGGYDGRGVWFVANREQAIEVVESTVGRPMLVEQFVRIEREIAVQVARRPGGDAILYPVVETVQRDGVFHESIAPAAISPALAHEAEEIARSVADAIDCVGILAVEMFVANGRLLTNELAARPHNTAHYTIEGCETSQFENHLRAVCDLPLGATTLTASAVATVNVFGPADGSDPSDRLDEALSIKGAHVHMYGKPARRGRKLGHVTVCASTRGDDRESTLARARAAAARLAGVSAPVAR